MGKSRRVRAAVKLRACLKEKGWSQSRLSEEISASNSEVSRWLSGDRKPSLKFACRLSVALGIPVEEWNGSEAKSA